MASSQYGHHPQKHANTASKLSLAPANGYEFPEKSEGPTTCIAFLGMELDTVTRIIPLPENTLIRLRTLLSDWSGCKAVKKWDLLSLIGYLQHASKAVRQGCSFL